MIIHNKLISRTITLNNGVRMPVLGFGVYQISKGETTEKAVFSALDVGYRMIDTAAFYQNEKDVGSAIRKSGIPRAEIFITTKLHPLTFFNIESAFHASRERLGVAYVDLYLIHWPIFKGARVWKILEKIYEQGYAKAIGVSNYTVKDLATLLRYARVVPAVNQVEVHPFLDRKKLRAYCASKGIIVEAHSPLTHGKRLDNATLQKVAHVYGKSPAQILIRWALQHGLAVLPKTLNKERMKENADVFDFEITEKDMLQLDSLDEGYHAAWLSRFIDARA